MSQYGMNATHRQPSKALISLGWLAGEHIHSCQVEPPIIYTVRGLHPHIQTL